MSAPVVVSSDELLAELNAMRPELVALAAERIAHRRARAELDELRKSTPTQEETHAPQTSSPIALADVTELARELSPAHELGGLIGRALSTFLASGRPAPRDAGTVRQERGPA